MEGQVEDKRTATVGADQEKVQPESEGDGIREENSTKSTNNSRTALEGK